MLTYIMIYYIILYYIVLYYNMLCSIIVYYMYIVIVYHIILYYSILYYTIQNTVGGRALPLRRGVRLRLLRGVQRQGDNNHNKATNTSKHNHL